MWTQCVLVNRTFSPKSMPTSSRESQECSSVQCSIASLAIPNSRLRVQASGQAEKDERGKGEMEEGEEGKEESKVGVDKERWQKGKGKDGKVEKAGKILKVQKVEKDGVVQKVEESQKGPDLRQGG